MSPKDEAPEIDTFNKFMIGVQGDDVVFSLQPLPRRLSKADALIAAAYLVALADDDERFDAILKAVRES